MASNDFTYSIQGKGLKFDTVEQLQPYLDELKKLDQVRHITLSGNTFGVDAAKAFADVLKTKNKIEVLDLSDIFTGRLRAEIPPALIAICDAIVDKENLVELNLSDNAFGPAGAEPLVGFLINNKALRVLRLNNNGLGVHGGTFIAEALIKAHRKNQKEGKSSTLRTFIAGRNRLENGSSTLLAQAFRCHESLTEIRMPQNGIRSEGIVALMEGISSLKNLEILDLQDNTFVEEGSYALSSVLSNWPKIRVLNVGDCLLKAKGALSLFDALISVKPAELEELILTYNEVSEKGAFKLAEAVKHLKKLGKLELNGNNFEEDSAAAKSIKDALLEAGLEDTLGSLSDMEILTDGEEEDEVDELADKIGKLST
ncbi:Ran GAP Rna1 [Entomophthora muscae]|uniref:Ran GAP Rna1 n=1 Tax=Entomophthora muscae TaxID=34485 RepID=A0ACC2SGK2_9FUNG|nr:Ran GAP Rna1 [Entomophthora muscae]